MSPERRAPLIKALLSLVLLSLAASRFPYGASWPVWVSLVGCGIGFVFALGSGEPGGPAWRRGLRAALALIGILVLWAGTVAAATATAGFFHARSHNTPYTAMVEVVMAAICAVLAPPLLTFKAGSLSGGNRIRLGLLWLYWLAFYPATALAVALGPPWTALS